MGYDPTTGLFSNGGGDLTAEQLNSGIARARLAGPGWTGTAPRSIDDRSKEAVNVLDWSGWDATGANDITAKLQAALDQAATAGVPDVILPAGTMVLSAPVQVSSGTTVRGKGRKTVLRAAVSYSNQYVLFRNKNWQTWAPGGSGQQIVDTDITFMDVLFDWSQATDGTHVSGHSIDFTGVRNARTIRCHQVGGSNLASHIGCDQTWVHQCKADGLANNFADHWGGTTNAIVSECQAVMVPWGVQDGNPATYTGTFGITLTGIVDENDSYVSSDALFIGNTITTGAVAGQTGGFAGIMLNCGGPNAQVLRVRAIGNTLISHPSYPYGSGIFCAGGAAGQMAGHLLLGNTLRNFQHGPAIQIDAGGFTIQGDISVLGNTFQNCAVAAPAVAVLQAYGPRQMVQGNRFAGCTAPLIPGDIDPTCDVRGNTPALSNNLATAYPASGGTYTTPNAAADEFLSLFLQGSALTSLTINLPSAAQKGQRFAYSSLQSISGLTWVEPNGHTLYGFPTSMTPDTAVRAVFDGNAWYHFG